MLHPAGDDAKKRLRWDVIGEIDFSDLRELSEEISEEDQWTASTAMISTFRDPGGPRYPCETPFQTISGETSGVLPLLVVSFQF
jgi:hypothetical protein